MTSTINLKRLGFALAVAAIATLVATGCGDEISPTRMPAYVPDGKVVVLMHDAPVDSLQEVWLTVNSIRFIGEGGGNLTTVLDEPMRLNFLDLDSVSAVMGATTVEVESFSKIRLEVSDPEFLDKDGNVVAASDIKLVANGKIDLNFQGPVTVESGDLTVVSIDLDLDNSIKVNKTGKGKYILHPQFKVDAVIDTNTTTTIPIEILDATIIRVNATLGTIDLELPGSPAILVVYTNEFTTFEDAGGAPIQLTDLIPASQVRVFGHYDPVAGNFVATKVQSL